MNCKYTFLLPAYKSAFLDKALQSIMKQTYANFKVLISDDCSPENIRGICEPYLDDERFQYRRNGSNMGSKSLVLHWNMLVDLCDTEYFIIASDDDFYDISFLERINTLVSRYPELDLFRARTCRINEEDICFDVERISEEFENQISFIDSMFNPNQVHCIGNYVFKKKHLVDMGYFMDFPLGWFSDDATVILCSEKGIANTSEVLFSFRYSNINISGYKSSDCISAKKKILACCLFYDWIKQYNISHETNLYNNYLLLRIRRDYHQHISYLILNYFKQLDIKSFWHLIKWMKRSGFERSFLRRLKFLLKWLGYFA